MLHANDEIKQMRTSVMPHDSDVKSRRCVHRLKHRRYLVDDSSQRE